MSLILSLHIKKHQSYKAFVNYLLWRHTDDVIEALDLKTKNIFEENMSNYIMLPNLSLLQWKTPKL